MKFVIDVPDILFGNVIPQSEIDEDLIRSVIKSSIDFGSTIKIASLPRGHGTLIDVDNVLAEIDKLKKSPWYKEDYLGSYLVRKDAVGIIEDLVIKNAPTVVESDRSDDEDSN